MKPLAFALLGLILGAGIIASIDNWTKKPDPIPVVQPTSDYSQQLDRIEDSNSKEVLLLTAISASIDKLSEQPSPTPQPACQCKHKRCQPDCR